MYRALKHLEILVDNLSLIIKHGLSLRVHRHNALSFRDFTLSVFFTYIRGGTILPAYTIRNSAHNPLFHLIQTYPFLLRRSTRGGALVATHRIPFLLRPTSPLALPLLFSHLGAPEAAGSVASPTHPSLSRPISHSSRGSSRCHLRRLIQATTGESRHREAQTEVPSTAAPSHPARSGARGHQSPPATFPRWLGFRASAPAPVAMSSSSHPVSASPPLASTSLSLSHLPEQGGALLAFPSALHISLMAVRQLFPFGSFVLTGASH